MPRFLIGLFIALHGLVHLWYFVLSQQLVAFKPEMGWTGKSWLFTGWLGDPTARSLAGGLYLLATVALVAGGVAVFARLDWWRPLLAGAAIVSAVVILLTWDGSLQLALQKGLLGAAISAAILLAVLLLKGPLPSQ